MIVSELVDKLKTMPQDKSVTCQVVGQETGAWNMEFEVEDVKSSWMVNIRVSHPDLKTLPDVP